MRVGGEIELFIQIILRNKLPPAPFRRNDCILFPHSVRTFSYQKLSRLNAKLISRFPSTINHYTRLSFSSPFFFFFSSNPHLGPLALGLLLRSTTRICRSMIFWSLADRCTYGLLSLWLTACSLACVTTFWP